MEHTLEDQILDELEEIDRLRAAIVEDLKTPLTDEEKQDLPFDHKLRRTTDAMLFDFDARMRHVHQLNFVQQNRSIAEGSLSSSRFELSDTVNDSGDGTSIAGH